MDDNDKRQNINDSDASASQNREQVGDSENRRPSFRTEEVAADSGQSLYSQSLGNEEKPQQPTQPVNEYQQSPVGSVDVSDPPTPPPIIPNPAASILRPETEIELEKVPEEPVLPRRKGPPKILLVVMAVLLVLVVVLLVLTRGKNNGGGGDDIGKKGEIIWWGIEESETAIKPLIEDYQNNNPNVKITYRQVARDDYRERLTNAIAGGKGPDIYEIHNTWLPMFKNDVYPAPSSVISQAEFAGSFYPVVVSNMSTADGVVGLPLYYDAITLFVNENIFTSAARDYPETWNELRDLVDPKTEGSLTLYNPEGRIIQAGVALGAVGNVDYWQDIIALMMTQNQANLNKPEGNSTRDTVIFYRLFTDVYKTWDNTLPNSINAFARGNAAMIFAPSREAISIINSNPDLKFKTIPMTQLVKDKPSDPDVVYANYWSQAVWRRSVNRELAWDFLKYLATPDTLQKLNQTRKTSGQLEKAYPRMDMASLQQNHPLLGSVVVQAQYARSWYLADKTNDGSSGLNTLLANEFEKLLINQRVTNKTVDEEFTPAIVKILTQYGLVR